MTAGGIVHAAALFGQSGSLHFVAAFQNSSAKPQYLLRVCVCVCVCFHAQVLFVHLLFEDVSMSLQFSGSYAISQQHVVRTENARANILMLIS
jgi:hypothetical protein